MTIIYVRLSLSLSEGMRAFRVVLLALGLSIFACFAPATLSAQGSSPTAGNFDKEWADLIAAAKHEGRVVIAAGGEPSRNFRPLVAIFQKKFGVKAEMSTGSATDTVNRLLAERRGGRNSVDVGLVAQNTAQRRLVPAGALIPIEPLLMHPEVTNKSLWFGGRYWYADADQKYVFLYAATPQESWNFYYNTDKFVAKEIATIKTVADFLNPKWKGKMAALSIGDPSGLANLIDLYVSPDAGPSWVKRYMFETGMTFVEDRRLLETWLTQGKFPLQFPPVSSDQLVKLENAGLPIKRGDVPIETPVLHLTGSSCCIEAFESAPNPNAAKLFINWFLSKEGQTEVNRIKDFLQASLREDIGYGNVDPSARRRPGAAYQFYEAEPWRAERSNEAVKQIQQWWEDRQAGKTPSGQ
jgi:iron(III) transport system substrate-binding protein